VVANASTTQANTACPAAKMSPAILYTMETDNAIAYIPIAEARAFTLLFGKYVVDFCCDGNILLMRSTQKYVL